jgi:hypothetical protein
MKLLHRQPTTKAPGDTFTGDAWRDSRRRGPTYLNGRGERGRGFAFQLRFEIASAATLVEVA